jgi:Zn-dependent protease with chaperone function
MDLPYPPAPLNVPNNVSEPGPKYKKHAWLALLGLITFALLYFATAGWLGYTCYRFVRSILIGHQARGIFGGVLSGFLAIMMLRGIFRRRSKSTDSREIKASDEPMLFEFIYRVASEVGAPKPASVHVSREVGASVFYQVSFINLFWPVKKRLHIGLGLVNALNLSEFKAVLAHEFGHFAQKTGTVGRYLYTAQIIVSDFIGRRDWIDRGLRNLSHWDLRVAWIGWLLRVLVWSLRSVFETLWSGLIVLERALSREMEFQADCVAVTAAGSSAIATSLYRLRAADSCMDQATGFLEILARKKHRAPDVFALQSQQIKRMSEILDDPTYFDPPAEPEDPALAASHRIFKLTMAQPPKMWSTHPPNTEREENAKRMYVACDTDKRSPWILFADAAKLKSEVTAEIYKKPELQECLAVDASLEAFREEYADVSFDRRFRGMYLGRAATRSEDRVAELFGPPPADIEAALAALYPETLRTQLDSLRELEIEKAQLKALIAGAADATGGVVRFRGTDRKRHELPALLATVEDERRQTDHNVSLHQKNCRSAHAAAAAALSDDWHKMYNAHVQILHYAEHVLADLADVFGYFQNELGIVLADGKLSSSERSRLISAAGQAFTPLEITFAQKASVTLTPAMVKLLDGQWPEVLGEWDFAAPTDSNLASWVENVDGWAQQGLQALNRLRIAALNELLRIEDVIRVEFADRSQPSDVPPAPRTPRDYATRRKGDERPRQDKLGWWDRFQIGDGLVPSAARFVIAGAIGGGLVLLNSVSVATDIYIYNGLERQVNVSVNGKHISVAAMSYEKLSTTKSTVQLVATTVQGEPIETLDENIDSDEDTYIYNVASAGVLAKEEIGYGVDVQNEPTILQPRAWQPTRVSIVFDEPPKTSKNVEVKERLRSINEPPEILVYLMQREKFDGPALAQSHARWIPLSHPMFFQWAGILSAQDEANAILIRQVREQTPVANLSAADAAVRTVALGRWQQDADSSTDVATKCQSFVAAAKQAPNSGDAAYLAARCAGNTSSLDQWAVLTRQFPNNAWVHYGHAMFLSEAGQWHESFAQGEMAKALDRNVVSAAVAGTMLQVAQVEKQRELLGSDADEFMPRSIKSVLMENASKGPWADLHQGQVDKSWSAATSDKRLMQMVALSSNAPDTAIEALLKNPADKVAVSAMMVWALAKQRGADVAPWESLIRKEVDAASVDRVMAFLHRLSKGIDVAAAETALGAQDPSVRGNAYMAAVILLGADCPPRWRELANFLLFNFEKPYRAPGM